VNSCPVSLSLFIMWIDCFAINFRIDFHWWVQSS
jgi:hypothetical protein